MLGRQPGKKSWKGLQNSKVNCHGKWYFLSREGLRAAEIAFFFIYLFICLFKWEIYYSDRSVESSTQSSQLSKLSVYIARGYENLKQRTVSRVLMSYFYFSSITTTHENWKNSSSEVIPKYYVGLAAHPRRLWSTALAIFLNISSCW